MCDQCAALMINGIACHETGCPNSWLHPITDRPYDKACHECGCDFTPETREQRICDDCAAENDPDDPALWMESDNDR